MINFYLRNAYVNHLISNMLIFSNLDYQKKLWIEGSVPGKLDSWRERMCMFFNDTNIDDFLTNYNPDYGLIPTQINALWKLQNKLKDYSNHFDKSFKIVNDLDIINDPKWHKVVECAKDTLKAFEGYQVPFDPKIDDAKDLEEIAKDQEQIQEKEDALIVQWPPDRVDFFRMIKTGREDINHISKSTLYYLNQYDRFQRGKKLQWNWSAFFLGGIWGAYRKNFLILTINLTLNVFVAIYCDKMLKVYNTTLNYFEILKRFVWMVVPLGISIIIFHLYCGLHANKIYIKQVLKQDQKIFRCMSPRPFSAFLVSLGLVYLLLRPFIKN